VSSGVKFAYIKATEGTTYLNPHFASDNSAAKSNGLYVGAYVFGRPDANNPVAQADYFVNNAQWTVDGKTLPPMLDMEWPYEIDAQHDTVAPYPCYGISPTAMVSWMSAFLGEVTARTGVTPMIYTNINWWNPCTNNSAAFSSYLLDPVTCGTTPASFPGWGTNWTFWQYDIPDCGDGAALDLDVYRGTLSQLAQLAGGSAAGQLRDRPSAAMYGTELHVVDTAANGAVSQSFLSSGSWTTQNLGGTITSAPSASVYNGGFYVVGSNGGKVYQKWYNGSTWSSWAQVSTGSDPVNLVYNNEYHVISRAGDGSVINAWYTSSAGWNTQNLGGTITSAPAVTVYNGEFHVVGSNNGTVYQKFYDGSAWSTWSSISTGSDPQAAVFGTQFHVVSRASDGSVRHVWYTPGGGWAAQTVGGSIAGPPAVTTYQGGFYVVGSDGASVTQTWYNGTSWSNWAVVSSGAEPTQLVNGSSYYVFSRASSGGIVASWYDGSAWHTTNLAG
jgi:GH25 family lysozyme M1 (1,4-beta-N-acetylmuramidase)